MSTDKARVTGYLGADADEALQRYAYKRRLTKSAAIERLITEILVKGNCDTPEEIVISSDYESRLEVLESSLQRFDTARSCLAEKLDKIDEHIACLEDNYSRLARQGCHQPAKYLGNDEAIKDCEQV